MPSRPPRPQANPRTDPILFALQATRLGWSDRRIALAVRRDARTLRRWRARARALVGVAAHESDFRTCPDISSFMEPACHGRI